MNLSTHDIHVKLNGSNILNGVDLKASDGHFVGIIGPNGSGKSTLLKCIYRVLKANVGTVFLDGKELSRYSVKESAKKIGVVAQHNNSGFDFSVHEMVMIGRAPHKTALEHDNSEDYRIVNEALKTVNMEDLEKRNYSSLSGGERQRVMLARALAQQTPCLILDEPTNHLDIKYQLQLMRIVKQSGRTIISAIHDLNIAAMFCDELYVMSEGRVYAQGTPREVLTEELIQDVYGVNAMIIHEEGKIYIVFRE